MAQLADGVVNPDNIKLEPMLFFLGRRQRDCITALAESSLSGGEYFDFEVTDFDGVITQYRAWYDIDNGSSAPAAGGRTLIEIDIASGDTAIAVATKSASDIDATAGLTSKSVNDEFYIVSHAMGAVGANAVDGGAPTGFTFENEDAGAKEFLGATQDAAELNFADGTSFVDIKANETGDILLAQLTTAVGVTVSANVLELTAARWKSIVGEVLGNTLTPAGGTELTGLGQASIGRNLFTVGKELLMKPVNSGSDNSRNLTFFKTAPIPESATYSGVDPSALTVSFNAYLDNRIDPKVNLWAFGDSFQDVQL